MNYAMLLRPAPLRTASCAEQSNIPIVAVMPFCLRQREVTTPLTNPGKGYQHDKKKNKDFTKLIFWI